MLKDFLDSLSNSIEEQKQDIYDIEQINKIVYNYLELCKLYNENYDLISFLQDAHYFNEQDKFNDMIKNIEVSILKKDYERATLFINSYYIFNIVLNQLRQHRKFRNSYLLASDSELEKYQSEYKLKFVFGNISIYDLEIRVQEMIKFLIDNGDNRKEINKRNLFLSVYKYCKIKENS